MPLPITIPYPQPTFPTMPAEPGVSPGVSPGASPSVGVSPGGGGSGGSIGGEFAKLFDFNIDWRWAIALLFLALTVGFVDNYAPEYVWQYVGILILGVMVVQRGFGPNLKTLVGR